MLTAMSVKSFILGLFNLKPLQPFQTGRHFRFPNTLIVQTLIFTGFNTPLHSQPVKYVMKPLEIHRNMDATTAVITIAAHTMNLISIRRPLDMSVHQQEVKHTLQV